MEQINHAYEQVNDFKTMMNRITSGVAPPGIEKASTAYVGSGNRAERRAQAKAARRAGKQAVKA